MKQTWRWFGPHDTVSINDMAQAGVEGVVTALHHIPNGEIWSIEQIQQRQSELSQFANGTPSNLAWEVVESLPVSEDIKRQTGQWRQHIENYKKSIENLAACGIQIICYNFMPVLDWTRTSLDYELPNGARCMRFDEMDFAVFDIHLLKRANASEDFTPEVVSAAAQRFKSMNDDQCTTLVSNIVCGLPGAEQGYSLADMHEHLQLYKEVSAETLRQHQIEFLSEIMPTAEQSDVRLCCHPDDPPFSLLGLPRVMSTEEDYRHLLETVKSPANGITLCSGSLGVKERVARITKRYTFFP